MRVQLSTTVLLAIFVLVLSTSSSADNGLLIAYYNFDDGTVGGDAVIVTDSGPNDLFGIAGQSGISNPEYSPGFNGASLEFFRQFGDSFVEVPDFGTTPLDLTGPHTIEAFICPTFVNQSQVIVRDLGGLGGNDGGLGGYYLAIDPSGRLVYALHDDDYQLLSNTVLTPGDLHHVAATWDGTLMKLYVDHQLDAAMVYTGNLLANNSSFGIGALLRDNGTVGHVFQGKIDEVRISGVALDPDQMIHVLPADTVNVLLGTVTAGTLDETYISDDDRLEIASGFPFSPTSASIWLEFETTLPNDSPANLVVALESHVTDIGISQEVELFNFDTFSYEQVDDRNMQINNESTAKIEIQGDLQRFVQAGTGLVRTRVTYTSNGAGFFASWNAEIDQITWTTH